MTFQPMQLSLGVNLQDDLHFDNFLAGQNLAVLTQLQQMFTQEKEAFQFVYLWGAEDSGKTHLLKAVCQQAQQLSKTHCYLDLGKETQPEVLSSVTSQVVCIDNLQQIASQPAWEEGLFHLFNRIREQQGLLVFSASSGPAHLGIVLPDLLSRLSWGLTYHLQALQDDEKLLAFKLRARQRGMDVPDEVIRYLIHRSPRKLSGLFALLDLLDEASLKEQRKLTIPFVRQALNW
ncbi:DnaA regulatory inactivator Hda [Marinospirillum insulare]|uniref:DnaA regulatory inactivator Hda n=1 Tax=Marinospirillum insulare TaxID=217169 RepID=A0ABQ6A0V4_9GAMM|nr:DnaA regulatory inactivator Hda [Marinospirillum insulare]GLR63764.1 DnaA regulatory inactivator Hda [Marinospirillum insulare]